MRIVGGAFRGRTLATPSTNEIRPTSDRARETLFNILSHRPGFDFEGLRVLDLFSRYRRARHRGAVARRPLLPVRRGRDRGAWPDPPEQRGVRAGRPFEDLPARRDEARDGRRLRALRLPVRRPALRTAPGRGRAGFGARRPLAAARRPDRRRGGGLGALRNAGRFRPSGRADDGRDHPAPCDDGDLTPARRGARRRAQVEAAALTFASRQSVSKRNCRVSARAKGARVRRARPN